MLTARDSNGKRIPVFNKDGTKNHEGFCPCCGKSLNARAGEIRRPHWAHTSVERCDEWWENEEEWHYEWRKLIDITEHSCEVDIENVLEKDNVRHFYDARINNRLSIILRRGKLSEDQIQQYESFFGDMLWIVEAKKSNITRFHRMKDSGVIREIAKRRGCYSMRRGETGFYEKWAKCKAPVVLDFGENEKNEKNLWVILPNNDERVFRYIINFSKKELLDRILKEGNLFRNGKTLDDVLKDFDEKIKEIDCEFTEFGNGRRRRSSNQDEIGRAHV